MAKVLCAVCMVALALTGGWCLAAAPTPPAKATTGWVKPAEGATVSGVTTLQVDLPANINREMVRYYLEARTQPDFPTARKKVEHPEDWENDNGDPMVGAIIRDYFTALFSLIPQAQTSTSPLVFPTVDYTLTPGGEEDPEYPGSWQPREDFCKPTPVDFSYFLPGQYRLVMEVNDKRFVRNITIASKASAPEITILPPVFAPDGNLLVRGTWHDADIDRERRQLFQSTDRDYRYERSGIIGLSRDGIALFVDGRWVGMAQAYFREKLIGEETVEWEGEIAIPVEDDMTRFVYQSGEHLFSAMAVDLHGNIGVASCVARVPLSRVQLECVPADTSRAFTVNQKIRITTVPIGGTAPRCTITVSDDTTTTTLCKDTPATPITWTPTRAGTYTVTATVREADGSRTRGMRERIVIPAPLTAVKLQANPATAVPAGTPITLTAACTGGDTPELLYEQRDGTRWHHLASEIRTARVVIDTPGTYTFRVTAEDGRTEKSVSDTITCTLTPAQPLQALQVTVNALKPFTAKNEYKLDVRRAGGTSKTYYRVYTSDDGTHWRFRSAHDDNGGGISISGIVQPRPLYYRIVAVDETTGGQPVTVEQRIDGAPYQALSGVHLQLDDAPRTVGSSIVLSATAIGSYQHVEYTYSIDDGGGWHVLSQVLIPDFGDQPAWLPVNPGTYRVRVRVIDLDTLNEFVDETSVTITDWPF